MKETLAATKEYLSIVFRNSLFPLCAALSLLWLGYVISYFNGRIEQQIWNLDAYLGAFLLYTFLLYRAAGEELKAVKLFERAPVVLLPVIAPFFLGVVLSCYATIILFLSLPFLLISYVLGLAGVAAFSDTAGYVFILTVPVGLWLGTRWGRRLLSGSH